MKTAEQILDHWLDDFPWIHSSKQNALKAMNEFAEQQVKLFNTPPVSKSVCNCGIPEPDSDRECCMICGKLIHDEQQTVC